MVDKQSSRYAQRTVALEVKTKAYGIYAYSMNSATYKYIGINEVEKTKIEVVSLVLINFKFGWELYDQKVINKKQISVKSKVNRERTIATSTSTQNLRFTCFS